MESVFRLKIDNFLSDHRKKRNSVEFHCVLKGLPKSPKRISISHTLPHPITSSLHRIKHLFLCSESDALMNKVSALIDECAENAIKETLPNLKSLVRGFVLNECEHVMLDEHIIGLCFDFYFSKEQEMETMRSDSLQRFGLNVLRDDEMKERRNDRKYFKKVFNANSKYKAIWTSNSMIGRIPRLIGPQLGRIGKFPRIIPDDQDLKETLDIYRRRISFRLKKKKEVTVAVLSGVIGDTEMKKEHLIENIFSVMIVILSHIRDLEDSEFTKSVHSQWKHVKKVSIKTSHGQSLSVYNDKDIVSKHELPTLVRKYRV